jgi:hypothetical protein
MPDWYDETFFLRAIRQNGQYLRYIKCQTEELCLLALSRDPYAYKHIKEKQKKLYNILSESILLYIV